MLMMGWWRRCQACEGRGLQLESTRQLVRGNAKVNRCRREHNSDMAECVGGQERKESHHQDGLFILLSCCFVDPMDGGWTVWRLSSLLGHSHHLGRQSAPWHLSFGFNLNEISFHLFRDTTISVQHTGACTMTLISQPYPSCANDRH